MIKIFEEDLIKTKEILNRIERFDGGGLFIKRKKCMEYEIKDQINSFTRATNSYGVFYDKNGHPISKELINSDLM
jgi:hypothetical protein